MVVTRYDLGEDELDWTFDTGVEIDGEIVTPRWRWVCAPGYDPKAEGEYLRGLREVIPVVSGKWLIFIGNLETQFITHWGTIKEAVLGGRLGPAAKVANPQANDDTLVICVYTKDCYDEADVMRVREELRKLGYLRTLPYKPDSQTLAGEYGSHTIMYRA